ncbi:HD domain-containing phosphohydrolase [Georgenia yuyongxinii]|uniref:HD domain-containing protein n=1 Tax=Georgenia yuyongxinii TaxID=2589797 RepID=A0A552WPJ7_9MICO|nr:HD domain-containing phosphohydrolase [Georgenia yuyongxinii]TRW44637.1 HD domain-containing protein [Georgenia yuyongxinii]
MIRLLGILGGLSGALDLGTGAPLDESLVRCVAAVRLARAVGCTDEEVRVVLYASLLEHLGCTAASHAGARLFGDDVAVVRYSFVADLTRPVDVVRTFVPGVAAASGRGQARTLLAAVRAARDSEPPRATCEVASGAARRLGLGDGVVEALGHVTAQWDGEGYPPVRGTQIPLATRIVHVAGTAVLLALRAGSPTALAEVRRRARTQLDPDLVEAFTVDLLDGVTEPGPLRADGPAGAGPLDPLDVALELEPDPVRHVDDRELEGVARTFGDLVDLKSPRLQGHSAAVAGLASDAAGILGLPEMSDVRLAGHLHDLGRIAVSSRIWSKTGPLTAAERDQARLHPYYTERILARLPELAAVATTAARHHERSDGSGYHRGLRAVDLSMPARVLAAADAYRSALESRPGRGGHQRARAGSPTTEVGVPAGPRSAEDGGRVEAAVASLTAAARAGRLDPDAVAAVQRAAGRPGTTAVSGVAGLTGRQVEVLRLVAAGLSNREVAQRLAISPRTAEHHLQDVYQRIGASTRAAAALFAMEHGLL